MKPLILAALAATALSPPPQPRDTSAAGPTRLPRFASTLASRPTINGPSGWTGISDAQAWATIARAGPKERQQARWAYATSLIGAGRAAEALGVLDVMRQDDPDLKLVDSYRLARGAALARLHRPAEAISDLGAAGLASNPEACLWRIMAFADARLPEQAMGEVACAASAVNARAPAARAPFRRLAAREAIRSGRAAAALDWLRPLPANDTEAGLLRGKALALLGRDQPAREAFARVVRSGAFEQRLDAELATLELATASGKAVDRQRNLRALERIRFVWRGGDIEERALRLTFRLADEGGDLRGALAAGSTLLRYFNIGTDSAALLERLQALLAAALDSGNSLSLDQSAALFWDHRDLAPLGPQGDYLVGRLGERLQSAGLYARAAELFEHQLFARAKDLAQGPLSVRVAALHILASRPDRALVALRKTQAARYPDAMLWDRRRVEAVALVQLGKPEAALALLDDAHGSAALRAEIHWKMEDWTGFTRASRPALPSPQRLTEVDQAMVLRHAIALAMLRDEAGLASLRQRYGAVFAGLPSGGAFAVLTGDMGSLDSNTVIEAMASIPSASPAGELGDLLDAGVGAKS